MTLEDLDKLNTNCGGVLNNNNSFTIVDVNREQYGKDKDSDDGKEVLGIIPVIVSPYTALYYQNFSLHNEIGNAQTIISATNSNGVPVKFQEEFTSDDINRYSISKELTLSFPQIDYVDSETIDRKYFKQIGVVLIRAVKNSEKKNQISF